VPIALEQLQLAAQSSSRDKCIVAVSFHSPFLLSATADSASMKRPSSPLCLVFLGIVVPNGLEWSGTT
jgi:hypothetical protein